MCMREAPSESEEEGGEFPRGVFSAMDEKRLSLLLPVHPKGDPRHVPVRTCKVLIEDLLSEHTVQQMTAAYALNREYKVYVISIKCCFFVS